MKPTSQEKKAEEILLRFDLKKTNLRLRLIQLFLTEERTFSQAEIISELEGKNKSVDRVSIYRNLNQLRAAGIVHELETNKYACCSHSCDQHAHVVLYCQTCEKHSELKDHQKLNKFFKAMGALNFLSANRAVFLKGICQTCAS